MSDIFISYAQEDRESAETLVGALEGQGWSVWWDKRIATGRVFDEVIEEALASTQCVVVLWSKASVGASKRWIREEIEEGARRNILVPVRIEETRIPFGYRRIQTASLVGWVGDESAAEFQRLVRDITTFLGPPPGEGKAPAQRTEESGEHITATAPARATSRVRHGTARGRSPTAAKTRPKVEPPETEERGLWIASAMVFAVMLTIVAALWAMRPELPAPSQTLPRVEPIPIEPPQIQQASGSESMPTAPGAIFRDCEACPEMVIIPAGEFLMGSPENEVGRFGDEERQHPVSVAGFALGRYEVTAQEFAASGLEVENCVGWPQEEREPVRCVSWEDARRYVEWLSGETGQQYRLPSEAEWEVAARAGTETARFWGDDPDDACEYANVSDQTVRDTRSGWSRQIHECRDGFVDTAPVGSFQANDFELHDMLGNVWEWTGDCWNEDPVMVPADGSVREDGNCAVRVIRGGSRFFEPASVRSAVRYHRLIGDRVDFIGFRVARVLP